MRKWCLLIIKRNNATVHEFGDLAGRYAMKVFNIIVF